MISKIIPLKWNGIQRILCAAGFLTTVGGMTVSLGADASPSLSWPVQIDRVKADPALQQDIRTFLKIADQIVSTDIVSRVYRLEDVGVKGRTWLDGRSKVLEDEIRQTFALAMSDCNCCNTVFRELPVLSVAYRLTGDEKYLKRAIRQLEEMTTWSPIQRPGWTCYMPGKRLPKDGKDGNWLATGVGVRAIADTLEILPPGSIDDTLLGKLHELLRCEIDSIVEDWKLKRPWFVRGNNPITNQWVLPTEGLVRACLVVGPDAHREAYELGVKNMLLAVNAHGEHGEFEEGASYATMTVNSMLHAGRAMALAGDRRVLDHPFIKNFPTWYLHHLQPGDMAINCFDCRWGHDAGNQLHSLLNTFAVFTNDPTARWGLAKVIESPGVYDFVSLLGRAVDLKEGLQSCPLYADYERATRVNWRSSWDNEATGVWVRGGHKLDQHDHQDRGHVNFIHRGRTILIEAGTPNYDHPLINTSFGTGMGHNVLQLGLEAPEGPATPGTFVHYPGWQNRKTVAPITVNRLDDRGGDILVDGTAGYDDLERWHRTVCWSSDLLTVTDEVVLSPDHENVVLFRWHLGTEQQVSITGNGGQRSVSWSDAQIVFNAETPILVEQVMMPDNTLTGHTGNDDPNNVHTCIVVCSKDKVSKMRLMTKVTPK